MRSEGDRSVITLGRLDLQGSSKPIYFANPSTFVGMEKAFDRVPRKDIWWAMQKLGIKEWIIRSVQAIYAQVATITNTYK